MLLKKIINRLKIAKKGGTLSIESFVKNLKKHLCDSLKNIIIHGSKDSLTMETIEGTENDVLREAMKKAMKSIGFIVLKAGEFGREDILYFQKKEESLKLFFTNASFSSGEVIIGIHRNPAEAVMMVPEIALAQYTASTQG